MIDFDATVDDLLDRAEDTYGAVWEIAARAYVGDVAIRYFATHVIQSAAEAWRNENEIAEPLEPALLDTAIDLLIKMGMDAREDLSQVQTLTDGAAQYEARRDLC